MHGIAMHPSPRPLCQAPFSFLACFHRRRPFGGATCGCLDAALGLVIRLPLGGFVAHGTMHCTSLANLRPLLRAWLREPYAPCTAPAGHAWPCCPSTTRPILSCLWAMRGDPGSRRPLRPPADVQSCRPRVSRSPASPFAHMAPGPRPLTWPPQRPQGLREAPAASLLLQFSRLPSLSRCGIEWRMTSLAVCRGWTSLG